MEQFGTRVPSFFDFDTATQVALLRVETPQTEEANSDFDMGQI